MSDGKGQIMLKNISLLGFQVWYIYLNM